MDKVIAMPALCWLDIAQFALSMMAAANTACQLLSSDRQQSTKERLCTKMCRYPRSVNSRKDVKHSTTHILKQRRNGPLAYTGNSRAHAYIQSRRQLTPRVSNIKSTDTTPSLVSCLCAGFPPESRGRRPSTCEATWNTSASCIPPTGILHEHPTCAMVPCHTLP